MILNYSKDRKRVAYFDRAARIAAGVGVGKDKKEKEKEKEKDVVTVGKEREKEVVPKERKRKVKVPMVEGNEFAGTLELIVEGDEVFLVSQLPWPYLYDLLIRCQSLTMMARSHLYRDWRHRRE